MSRCCRRVSWSASRVLLYGGAENAMTRLGDEKGRDALRLAAQEANQEGLEARAACLAVEPVSAYYRRLLAESHLYLATVYASRGEIAVARERFAEALSLAETVGEQAAVARVLLDRNRSAVALEDLADVHLRLGDRSAAERHFTPPSRRTRRSWL
jgi:tetratricopeptide (TPR) repeat protein